MDFNTLFNSMLTGLFSGIGSTIAIWFTSRYFLKKLEKFEEKLRENEAKK
jgi:predicted RND superfamily exporter protein